MHKRSQRDRHFHTGSKAWRTIRTVQLQRFPMCEDCEAIGMLTIAVEVDHNTNDTSRNQIGVELSSLCKPCHSRRTARRMAGVPAVIGCDVDGWPLSPDHAWNLKYREQPANGGTPPQSLFHAKDRP